MSFGKRERVGAEAHVSVGKRGMLGIALCLAVGVLLLLLFPSRTDTDREGADMPSDALAAYGETLEEMVEELCSSVDGVGVCRVTITFSAGERAVYEGGKLAYTVPPAVRAVTVVCEGGARTQVRSQLTEMLSALFGIGAHRVSVLPLKT